MFVRDELVHSEAQVLSSHDVAFSMFVIDTLVKGIRMNVRTRAQHTCQLFTSS